MLLWTVLRRGREINIGSCSCHLRRKVEQMLIKAVAIQYPALGVWIRKDKGRNDGGGEGFLEEVGLESNIRE